MHTLLQDLRYAARQLGRSPVFTLVAVLSLGLGIGINTTLFSAVNGLLFRPLPVADPARLVGVYTSDYSGPPFGGSSYADFLDLQAQARSFAALAAARPVPLSLVTADGPVAAVAEIVSDDFFRVIGRPAARGRLLLPDDGRPGAAPAAVLSYATWERQFGADPGVVGRTLVIGGQPVTVVGVAAEGFGGTMRGMRVDLWLPVAVFAQWHPADWRNTSRGARGLTILGRLAPGATVASAQAELTTLAAQFRRAYPDTWNDVRGAGRRLTVLPESRLRVFPAFRGAVLGASGLLLTATALVLLIACANLANLLLARGAARQREIAIRRALGASRGRLVRQLLTESVLLAGLGGVVGVLAALWGTDLLTRLRPPTPLPLAFAFPLDGRVLAFAVVLALATGVLLGLVPALQASQPGPASALHGDADAPRGARLRGAFVVAQVAGSLVLLVVGGLFLHSLRNASRIDPGFGARRAVVLDLDLRLNGYTAERGAALYQALAERLRALPGVEAVGLTTNLPLAGHGGRRSLTVRGHTRAPGEELEFDYADVGAGYFEALDVPLVLGRGIGPEDRAGAPPVVVVNETFARRFWPGENPIGKEVGLEGDQPPYATVVGVARDGRYRSLGEAPLPFYYIPFAQEPALDATVVVRTAGSPAALVGPVRAAVRALDPALPITAVTTLDETLAASLLPARVAGGLLGALGLLGLTLAAIGLYGVMAYTVAQRTREIGIRMALGARAADVLRLVLASGLRLTAVGIGLGLAAALVCGRLAGRFLVGLAPTDPPTLLATAGLLVLVAAAAVWLPARRAARVDPVRALRAE